MTEPSSTALRIATDNPLSRLGIRLAEWSERWFPDAFSFAVIGVVVVFVAGMVVEHKDASTLAASFGVGFWNAKLVLFTMQMVLIILSGYAVATSPPVSAAIRALSHIPSSPRSATALVALFSMLASLFSWSFSLIFSGLLVRQIAARETEYKVDYRALGAAGFLGLGSVWALGLSSSAALLMTRPPDTLLPISGIIPVRSTLFLWQSMTMALVLIVASVTVTWWSTPPSERARDARSLNIALEPVQVESTPPTRPGEWLEYHPLLTILLCALGSLYLGGVAAQKGISELFSTLDNYILLMLLLGLLLHWRPRSFVKAIGNAMPATSGVVLQYPLYAGIFQMMNDCGLAHHMANLFVSVSHRATFPVLVSIYSGVLGMFVPSAGAKWVIEAPYLLDAAKTLGTNMGWVVQTYNAAEALPNLIHPFWMLPLLGILNLRAKDLVGYTSLQFVVHTPLVLLMVWLFNYTLPFVPPMGVSP